MTKSTQPASHFEIPEEVRAVRVCLVADPLSEKPWSGSGVPVGDQILATTMHEFSFLPLTARPLRLDGRQFQAEVYSTGGTDWRIDANDWLLARIDSDDLRPASGTQIDFERELRQGARVYLIGFPGDPTRIDRTLAEQMKPQVFSGSLVAQGSDGPRTFRVKLDDDASLGGISGGAAVVLDEVKREAVVVGICRGAAVQSVGIGLISWTFGREQVVVRPVLSTPQK
ncbi:MAG: hypothetical protein KF691_10415 [Phycisphaeraceae bacterium]|nr:hypothetical protein [Phycisphaeraceae bacterium]